jgi:hypothetical protein
MTKKEIPIQCGERTSICSNGAIRTILTTTAVVRHPIDIPTGSDVRLRCNHPTIGVLTHPESVRYLHPFNGIYVDREIPSMDLLGFDSEQETVEPCDHESLNVVGVAESEGLADDLGEAVHLRLTGPEPLRKRFVCIESVHVLPPRLTEEIHVVHELTPSYDLTYEPLNGIQGCSPTPVLHFNRSAKLEWVEKPKIERN